MASRNAQAYPFYVDAQGGGGKYLDTSGDLFASGSTDASGYGLGAALGLYYSPMERRGFDFQIGIESFFMEASQDPKYYATFVPYGLFRLQISMFYVSAGIAPFTWRRSEISPGFDGFGLAQDTLAYLGEFGMLYAATPKFSMGLSLNTQWFSVGGMMNRLPAVNVNFAMRFYFNLFNIGSNSAGGGGSLEYDGWRYIGK